MLRARAIVFDPGAVVTLHKHQSRPSVAYIIEGEMTEYRVGRSGKYVVLVKKSGEVAFDGNNVVHWWKMRLIGRHARLVMDIVPEN